MTKAHESPPTGTAPLTRVLKRALHRGSLWFPISFAVLLVGCELLVNLLGIPAYVVPPTSRILSALVEGLSFPLTSPRGLYYHAGFTVLEAGSGFLIGSLAGVLLGTAISKVPVLRSILLPYLVTLQSLPKVALAPLLVVWLGFGFESKVVTVVLLAFFPVMVNAMAGFESVDMGQKELLRSLRASRWQMFRYVELPSALPYIFAGLEVATVFSIAGAIVSEFVGARKGLGVLILQRNVYLDTAGTFSVFIVLAVVAIGWSRLLSMVRRRLLFWAPTEEKIMSM